MRVLAVAIYFGTSGLRSRGTQHEIVLESSGRNLAEPIGAHVVFCSFDRVSDCGRILLDKSRSSNVDITFFVAIHVFIIELALVLFIQFTYFSNASRRCLTTRRRSVDAPLFELLVAVWLRRRSRGALSPK
jgi:hypothetical protein